MELAEYVNCSCDTSKDCKDKEYIIYKAAHQPDNQTSVCRLVLIGYTQRKAWVDNDRWRSYLIYGVSKSRAVIRGVYLFHLSSSTGSEEVENIIVQQGILSARNNEESGITVISDDTDASLSWFNNITLEAWSIESPFEEGTIIEIGKNVEKPLLLVVIRS